MTPKVNKVISIEEAEDFRLLSKGNIELGVLFPLAKDNQYKSMKDHHKIFKGNFSLLNLFFLPAIDFMSPLNYMMNIKL